MEEAQRKMLSNRASLPAMADLAGWLQMGPGSMLRSLDMLERSELPLRVRLVDSGPADQTGHRAFWAVVAWLVTVVLFQAIPFLFFGKFFASDPSEQTMHYGQVVFHAIMLGILLLLLPRKKATAHRKN